MDRKEISLATGLALVAFLAVEGGTMLVRKPTVRLPYSIEEPLALTRATDIDRRMLLSWSSSCIASGGHLDTEDGDQVCRVQGRGVVAVWRAQPWIPAPRVAQHPVQL